MPRKRGGFLMAVGLLLLLGALGWGAWNVVFEEQGGAFAEDAKAKLLKIIPNLQPDAQADNSTIATGGAEPSTVSAETPQIETPQMQTAEIDGYTYIGVISVPALKIELPVMSDWSYPLLKRSPCRYAGSYLDDTLVIAGHSTRKHFSPAASGAGWG